MLLALDPPPERGAKMLQLVDGDTKGLRAASAAEHRSSSISQSARKTSSFEWPRA